MRDFKSRVNFREPLKIWALISCICAFSSLSAQNRAGIDDNESAASTIGAVSLVIGKAFIEPASARGTRAKIGDFIREGDTIRTESSGHVHIRFVDQAVLSVRPMSELQVIAYQFDPGNPENSLVKLNLIQGTARTVSGEAAKTARDRFRLNTPIAAIGVRGTDFVVSTTSDSLKALVNDGAIVVAPYSSQCLQGGTGPCNLNSIELGGETMQILEFDTEMTEPRLVPLLSVRQDAAQFEGLVGSLSLSSLQVNETEPANLSGTSSEDEDVTFREVITDRDVITEGVTSVDLGDKARVKAPYATGYTPESQISPEELRRRQLVWGRFADGKGNLERLTLPLSEAAEGREVSIGANFEYFLFRPEQGEVQVNSGLGEIGFSLASAQAYFKNGNEVSPVAVTQGDLKMDFVNSTFQTSLDLYHMQLGESQFNALGNIFPGGYFHFRDDQSRIVGGVSLDGRESGYFFDFYNWEGLVQGITLWDAK
ncbi:MAG: FecR domain-containing protein [Pseudohongiellaceae bacterium]